MTVFLLQLTNTLLLSRQWLANAGLALSLGLVLFHLATDRGHANLHPIADVCDVEALFFDHSDDLKLEAGVKTAALTGHVNSFEGQLSTPIEVSGDIRPLHIILDPGC